MNNPIIRTIAILIIVALASLLPLNDSFQAHASPIKKFCGDALGKAKLGIMKLGKNDADEESSASVKTPETIEVASDATTSEEDSASSDGEFDVDVEAIFEEKDPKKALSAAIDILQNFGSGACEMGGSAAACSGAYTKSALIEGIKIPIRIFRFDSSLEDIKKFIVIPLAGHLANFREAHGSGDAIEVSRVLGRMTAFLIQANIMIVKTFSINLTPVVTSTGVGAVMVLVPTGGSPKGVAGLLAKSVLSQLKTVIFSRNLTFSERMALLVDADQFYGEVLERLKTELGWHDLEAEIAEWRGKDAESTDEVEESLEDIGLDGPNFDDSDITRALDLI